jgi:hypothetical protein
MTPEPITPPERDFHIRAHTCYDLEETLVAFIQRILSAQRLDNPTLNLAQPDVVPFDYTERAQTLILKAVPRVHRGTFPRTVTGEIAIDKLPDFPAIIIQAISAHIEKDVTLVTARIFVCGYDENPDGGGYQDVINLTETIATALTSYGQQALDKAYPIVLPIDWNILEADTFPHYVAEMTTQWELPSGRPMPDPDTCFVPGESLGFDLRYQPSYHEHEETT